MSLITTVVWVSLGVLLVTTILVIVGQWRLFLRQRRPVGQADLLPVDSQAIALHLAESIRCQTTPLDEQGTPDPEAFRQLHQLLARLYPRVHAQLQQEVINGYSLLYIWPGRDLTLPPAQFMAHQDVVSCPEDTLADWTYPPFDGVIADGFIWGRGSLDIKNQVIGILEAAEALLAQGFQPRRTLHFAFGHDEETGGMNGARILGQLLHERGIQLAGIVDEGGGIFDGLVPKVQRYVAGICYTEKGYLTIEFRVKTESGHSSMPPDHTSIGILAAAMARLEQHPLRPTLKWARQGYWGLGHVVPLRWQIAFANSWLFGPLLLRMLTKAPEAATAIRTTQALTVFQAGYEDNTIPAEAWALVNFRLLPEVTIGDVVAHCRRVIGDERVMIQPVAGKANEALPPSSMTGPAYLGLERATQEVFGQIPVSPSIMAGGTDCQHYVEVCQDIYRFTPLVMDERFRGLEHGVNERIPVEAMAKMVQFYGRLMELWSSESMC